MATMNLTGAVRTALNAGLRDGCRVSPGSTWEVDALVGLFRTGLPALERELTTQFAGLGVRVGGVFCHGRPKVDLQTGPVSGKRCEIGDLLVITRYESAQTVTHRALLLQTKIGSDPRYPPPSADDYPQYVLYTTWPWFTYFRGQTRNVTPKRAHPGGQYGFLEVCNSGCPACSAAVALPPSPGSSPLEGVLVDMIMSSGGRATQLPPPAASNGWDRVVWDLLVRAVGELYRWSRAGARDQRSFNDGIFLARTRSPVPELLALAADEIAGAEEIASGERSIQQLFTDERLGPPGEADRDWPRTFADDPDRSLSVAVVECVAT